jgi:hypothetical protein
MKEREEEKEGKSEGREGIKKGTCKHRTARCTPGA